MSKSAPAVRLPLSSIDTECAVLGLLLKRADLAGEILPTLTDEDFFGARERAVYRAIRRVADCGAAPDVFTVANELGPDTGIQIADLCRMVQFSGVAENLPAYRKTLRFYRVKRDLQAGFQALGEKTTNTVDPEVILASTELLLARAREQIADEGIAGLPLFVPFEQVVASARAPEWLIERIAERDSIGVMFGESGDYKSFIATDWLLHIAAGRDWFGHKVQRGAAFYINGEGHAGLARRLAAWKIRHQVDNLPFFATTREVLIDDVVAIQAAADEIDVLAKRLGVMPVAIGIDTLARNMSGDESDTAQMNQFVAHVSHFFRSRFKAFVLVVHHVGHGDKFRERGAYSLRGAADARYLIKRPEGTNLEAQIEFLKLKDGEIPAPLTVKMAIVELGITGENSLPVTSLVVDRIEAGVVKNPVKKFRVR